MKPLSFSKPLVLSFLFMALSMGCATNEKDKLVAYSHFKIGVNSLAQGKRALALQQLLKAKELDPNNEIILNHLGLAYYFLDEHEQAIMAFKDSISQKPSYSEAHNNLGRTYIDVKDFNLARKHLFKASEDLTYQNKDKVWLNIGLSYFFENRFKESQNFFLKSISLNRKNCLAYNYFGRSQLEQLKFKKAAKSLDQAIFHCKRKGFDEPHYYSAVSLFRSGKRAEAIARLQEGKKLFPEGPNRKKIDSMMSLMKITNTK